MSSESGNGSDAGDDRRRDDLERDGSDSSCSGSVTLRDAPGPSREFPSPAPNISLGPPIHPPPPVLPYLYPPGLYPPGHPFAPPISLFSNAHAAMNHGLLFNAQLALAAQHPALFSHYSNLAHPHSPQFSHSNPMHHQLKSGSTHRFTPYTLPQTNLVGGSPLGSAFEQVTPGNFGHARSLSSSPSGKRRSVSPQPRPSTASPRPEPEMSPKATQPANSNDLKNIEKMVNGLDKMATNNGEVMMVDK
jgi:T-box protein 2